MTVFSRGTAFALCLSQAAIMIGVIFYYPPVFIQYYTIHPVIENGTISLISNIHDKINITTFSLTIPFMALSFIAVLFSTVTASQLENGMLQLDSNYSQEALYEAGLWDLIFWVFCSGAHMIVILIVMSPADIYGAVLSSLLIIYFLCKLCQPRAAQLSVTQENLNLLGYFAGLFVAGYNLPDAHTARMSSLFVMCILDYMLGVGHIWDQNPRMDTITNCRIFWVCSASCCLSALYGAWHDHLLIEK